MSALLQVLRRHAEGDPSRLALDPIDGAPVSYAELAERVAVLAERIGAEQAGRVAALQLDHGIDEVLLELAFLEAGVPLLSLPSFFTRDQREHAMRASGAAARYSGVAASDRVLSPFKPVPLPAGTARVTFTSGSTGAPKGVCLSADHLLGVAQAVVDAVGAEHAGRHLAVLPAGILLETVAGLFATLLAGGTYVCPPPAQCGFADSFRPDFAMLAARIAECRVTSLILVPEYLAGLVAALEANGSRLPLLTLVAVGGARTPPELIARARALDLPVRQGYGLTECGSVVSLGTAGEEGEVGSVGRPLGHMAVTLAVDGEVLIDGPLCLGTIGGEAPSRPLPTGDLGRIDEAGRLWIEGRKSNVFVTSHGRNVSPEWVEEALLAQPEIVQAFAYGQDLPFPAALIVPARPDADLAAAVARANAGLPEYAQVHDWREVAHFTPANGRLTGNGRLQRAAIAAAYLPQPDSFTAIEDATVRQRIAFLSVPQVRAGLAGAIAREVYVDYLTQAYHHVRHTVPLMQEARTCLLHRPDLVAALDEYIEEETGHEEWVLSDIAYAGGNAEAARHSLPDPATRAMVDHAYAKIRGGDPVAFFGMVYVLESVSVALASRGAGALAERLGLPPKAFTYLTSHGALDQSHMRFFAGLVNAMNDDDLASITAMAQEIFALFGSMFAAIELEPAHAAA